MRKAVEAAVGCLTEADLMVLTASSASTSTVGRNPQMNSIVMAAPSGHKFELCNSR